MYDTYLGRASFGRVEGEDYDDSKLAEDLERIWTYSLMEAGYKYSGILADFYWSEGYPAYVIKAKATPERETRTDVQQYFCHGGEYSPSLKRLEECAYESGVESNVAAYFGGIPLNDIIV